MESVNDFVSVAKITEIAAGTVKVVYVDDAPVGIANVGGRFYAFADVCTHDDGPVAEGPLVGCVIECPRHGAQFDIRTGAVLRLPAVVPIPVYDLKVDGDEIKVSSSPRE
ncbi:MAG TPA: non-heme iron oxygenase ferredoxin subunit [Anaerolineae bacterium]|jgi:3-phenylpropionate/trans-cinnamate dioxygenase ferredoxin component|nr:non-heme iron oxygenase ferredoxin subunit [Anaerolineae bacterium]